MLSPPDITRIPGPDGERGQSAVEFVLVLPIFLALVIGIVEFGNAWRTYQITTNVAREGARQAVLPGTNDAGVRKTVMDRLSGSGLDTTLATVVFNDGAGLCNSVGCSGQPEEVQVQFEYSFNVLGGVMRLICGDCGDSYSTVTMRTESVMRNE